jgi:predicted dithiol-disulfide oxidoreductase (DUF899 family)
MTEIQKLELDIQSKIAELAVLRKNAKAVEINNYSFNGLDGPVSLLQLFGDQKILFLIHNMGQGCRYCTTWADGLNPFLPHLESQYAVALVSKDDPQLQRRFANSRGWRFRMASHGGGQYIREQSVISGEENAPGMVCYERQGDQIYKKSSAIFGPGDLYCSLWHVLGLAGLGPEQFTPQYSYWDRPQKTDDGGKNLQNP